MIKKFLKYLIVAFINAAILTMLLILWTDRLELIFHDRVRTWEFLKILGFTIVSLLSMRILVNYFRKRYIVQTNSKIKIAVLLTLLISSYLYIDYTTKVFNNVILNGQFRNQIADKIKPSNRLANGTKAESLSIKEYRQITNIYWFPTLPDEASNISYNYGYDDFLPDYTFTLTYDLPARIMVDTMEIKKGSFSRSQTFVTIDKIKRVTYSEAEE